MKKAVFLMGLSLVAAPAAAETTAWSSVGGNVNSVAVRVGVDTTVSDGAFVGFDVGYGDSGAKDCETVSAIKYCWNAGRDISAEARIGTVSSKGSKLYAIAGYSNMSWKWSASNATTTVVRAPIKTGGLTAGAGYEWALGQKMFLRTEFRYGNYSKGFSTYSFMPALGFKF